MNQNIQQIFASSFYIDKQYAQSFAPLLLQFFTGKQEKLEKTKEERIANIQQSSHPEAESKQRVAIISIKQPILKFDSWAYFGTKTFTRILSELAADPNVMGVVLDIDSGGGSSYGTPEFYDYISDYPKPIVTYTDGYLCSAAYYIANPTDYIVANKRADYIGSIGAYTTIVDFQGILEKFGGKEHSFYATESTEKNSEYEEALKGNYQPYIKNILDPLVKTFQEDMKASRPNLNEKVFKGGVWNAEKSLEYGLIDEIGTLKTAVLKVIELSETVNSNSNLNTDMSKENSFPKLAAVLGVENVDVKKPHIFAANETVSLNVEQLQSIEAALTAPGDGQKLTDLQTSLDAANAAKTKAEGEKTAIENAIDTALDTTGLTTEKKATAVENIALMSEKLVEYGAKDGAEPTEVKATADPVQTTPETTHIFDSLIN